MNQFAERKKATRKIAQQAILSDHYPVSLRADMLKHFDTKRYDLIAELALSHDSQHRERPNKGKQGPERPLEVGEELQHIDWDLEKLAKVTPEIVNRKQKVVSGWKVVSHLCKDCDEMFKLKHNENYCEDCQEIRNKRSANDNVSCEYPSDLP